jgi:hypothetical protein
MQSGDAGVSAASTPASASEKDITRWQELTYIRPEGPWEMGNGGSFDRQEVRPISDEMLGELAQWLRQGYTPWNGRSIPLNAGDRQFMFLLYFSVQGLIARVRAAEKLAGAAPELLEALQEVLSAHEAEAKATLSWENARENFSDPRPEGGALTKALLRASEADKKARAAIAKATGAAA